MNLYAYVVNDPVNFIDPTGEIRWWAFAAAAGSIIGGTAAIIVSGAAIPATGGAAAIPGAIGVGAGFLALTSGVVALGYSFNDNPSSKELAAVNAVPHNYTTALNGAMTLAGGGLDPKLTSSLEGVESGFFITTDVASIATSPTVGKAIMTAADIVSGQETAQDMQDAATSVKSRQNSSCN